MTRARQDADRANPSPDLSTGLHEITLKYGVRSLYLFSIGFINQLTMDLA